MSGASSLRSSTELTGESNEDEDSSQGKSTPQGPPPVGSFVRSPSTGAPRPPPPSGPLSLLRKNTKKIINVSAALRSRGPGRWSFGVRDIPCLDEEDKPLIATFTCGGLITDENLGNRTQRPCEEAILNTVRQHCLTALRCSGNKDAHHDFSRDVVKAGVDRSKQILLMARTKCRLFGRSLAHFTFTTLRAAPVEWSGTVTQFFPAPKNDNSGQGGRGGSSQHDGVWRRRMATLDREGVLRMVTIANDADSAPSQSWTCSNCFMLLPGKLFVCNECGTRRKLESRSEARGRGAIEAACGLGATVGDEDEVPLDSKNLCAVQSAPHSHGRSFVVVATLNKLKNGTVMNAKAHFRGPGLVAPGARKGDGAPVLPSSPKLMSGLQGLLSGVEWVGPAERMKENDEAEKEQFSGGDNGVTRSLIFSCDNETDQRALYGALFNSTAPTLPTVRRAAQRLDMSTLKRLIEVFGVDPNRENAYGNTALILAVRSTMSEFERMGTCDCPEVALGEEVVEYLLCHGADPYRRDHVGKSAFDYLFATTQPKSYVRRKFLRLLNLARVGWDKETESVWLLRPVPDPARPGRLLFLRPGQRDKLFKDREAREEKALLAKRERAKAKRAAQKVLNREARLSGSQNDEGGGGGGDGSSIVSGGSSLGDDEFEDSDDDEEVPLLMPSSSCAQCGYSKLLLVEVAAQWVCSSCGYLDDWTDCPLDGYKLKRSAKQSPEEIIFWRRRVGKDPSSGPVAWHALEKTNLAAKLGANVVKEAQSRLKVPDPHRLTGKHRTAEEPGDTPPVDKSQRHASSSLDDDAASNYTDKVSWTKHRTGLTDFTAGKYAPPSLQRQLNERAGKNSDVAAQSTSAGAGSIPSPLWREISTNTRLPTGDEEEKMTLWKVINSGGSLSRAKHQHSTSNDSLTSHHSRSNVRSPGLPHSRNLTSRNHAATATANGTSQERAAAVSPPPRPLVWAEGPPSLPHADKLKSAHGPGPSSPWHATAVAPLHHPTDNGLSTGVAALVVPGASSAAASGPTSPPQPSRLPNGRVRPVSWRATVEMNAAGFQSDRSSPAPTTTFHRASNLDESARDLRAPSTNFSSSAGRGSQAQSSHHHETANQHTHPSSWDLQSISSTLQQPRPMPTNMPVVVHATFSVSGKHRRQAPIATYSQQRQQGAGQRKPTGEYANHKGGDGDDGSNNEARVNPFQSAPRMSVRAASKAAAARAEAELVHAQGSFNRQVSQSKFIRNIARQ